MSEREALELRRRVGVTSQRVSQVLGDLQLARALIALICTSTRSPMATPAV